MDCPRVSWTTAAPGRRAAARGVDALTGLATGLGVLALVHPLQGLDGLDLVSAARLGVPAGVLASLWIGVNAALLLGRGQTSGQWLLGVRVLGRSGVDPTLGQLLLREGLFWLAVVSGPVGWLGLLGEGLLAVRARRGVCDRLTATVAVLDEAPLGRGSTGRHALRRPAGEGE